MVRLAWLVAATMIGCGGQSDDVDSGSACPSGGSSSLTGVRLEFAAGARCEFSVAEASQGISVPLQVVVEAPGPPVRPRRSECALGQVGGLDVGGGISGGLSSPCNTELQLEGFEYEPGTYPGEVFVQPHDSQLTPGVHKARFSASGVYGLGEEADFELRTEMDIVIRE
ncbi:MAG: hypothetical protein KC766_37710 [Myxococcales bacterium]|nr:hypothetical protein [Myxococcales bacterium]